MPSARTVLSTMLRRLPLGQASVRAIVAMLLGLALVAGCGRDPQPAASGRAATSPAGTPTASARPLEVVATTGMLGDLMARVGGDRVRVRTLMGEGVDPHLYKPTRDDINALMNADLVIANGLHLEGKLGDSLERVRAGGRAVHELAQMLPTELLRIDAGEGNAPDPHVWMDPQVWARVAQKAGDVLAQADAAHAASHRARAETYAAELIVLHEYAWRTLGPVPRERRVLVTAHDAFGYFGRAYGVEVVGIQGISTESEAGVRDIERIVELLVSRRVPAVFVESTVSDRNIQALIAGAAARGHTVRIGGSLFSDAMGAAGTYEGTYAGMMDHNITTIARGLGASPPERGMVGRLAAPAEAPGEKGRP